MNESTYNVVQSVAGIKKTETTFLNVSTVRLIASLCFYSLKPLHLEQTAVTLLAHTECTIVGGLRHEDANESS